MESIEHVRSRRGSAVNMMSDFDEASSSDDEESCMPVHKGQLVSEATLWMPWVHLGNLNVLRDDTQLMSLESREFEQLVVSTSASYKMAVYYAKVFKVGMQRARGTDLIKQEFLDILMASRASGSLAHGFSSSGTF